MQNYGKLNKIKWWCTHNQPFSGTSTPWTVQRWISFIRKSWCKKKNWNPFVETAFLFTFNGKIHVHLVFGPEPLDHWTWILNFPLEVNTSKPHALLNSTQEKLDRILTVYYHPTQQNMNLQVMYLLCRYIWHTKYNN